MNQVMRRAIAFRAALVLLAVVLATSLAASAPVPPPWPVWVLLPLFFLAFWSGVATISIVTDRRLAVRAGRASPPWTGSNARWAQFAHPMPLDTAVRLATDAISNMGGRGVEAVSGVMVTGWVGSVFTNLARWQQYQLAVALSWAPDGSTVFTSCARPRFGATLFGAPKSQRLAASLQDELLRLINPG